MMLFATLAHATAGFDPSSPEAVFSGPETYTDDGTIRLWAEIARYDDPDRTLFTPVAYNAMTRWADGFFTPWIATCFGSATPPSSTFLLHVATGIGVATGTPILFVPGAGDNASRGFITMATHMDIEHRPVFALTFATPHGDLYQHAELLADAIAVVRARTGAEQVDLVGHSMGGIATAVYLSNGAGTEWDGGAYEAVGTRYQGDVRRAVLIAAPLAGIDTAYRWTAANVVGTEAEDAFSPTSWNTYYPNTIAQPWVSTDLADQDLLPDGADYFPGHRQVQARQDHPLPGTLTQLGTYALQPDWYTTYEGGLGLVSDSDGIDVAIEAGGRLLERLGAAGVDPGVELFILAGENPIMPNASQALWADWFGETWADFYQETSETWAQLISRLIGDGLIEVGVTEEEIQGLVSGALLLGEITGPSDGLVFVDSAIAVSQLTARGAEVVETRVVNLSHLDLLYASPITGALLIEDSQTSEDLAWEAALGARYTEADTINWVEEVLLDPSGEIDTDTAGDTATDTGAAEEDTDLADLDSDGKQWLGCGSCATGGVPPGWLLAVGAIVAVRRSRPRV